MEMDHVVVWSERYNIEGCVHKRDQKFYLCFEYNRQKYDYELCSAGKEAALFIESIALWELEKRLVDLEMEEAYALYVKKKG